MGISGCMRKSLPQGVQTEEQKVHRNVGNYFMSLVLLKRSKDVRSFFEILSLLVPSLGRSAATELSKETEGSGEHTHTISKHQVSLPRKSKMITVLFTTKKRKLYEQYDDKCIQVVENLRPRHNLNKIK